MEIVIKIVGILIISSLVVAAIGLVMAFPIMWLWNGIMPAISDAKTITVMQAWGLSVLTGLLFKGGSSVSVKD